tara:strand:+ start:14132 stop:14335 length:204 start_codon:yes stop_codon:yes gene_type:complete
MIQITDWLDPNDFVWIKNVRVKVNDWLELEALALTRRTRQTSHIKERKDGFKALFRTKVTKGNKWKK